MSSLGFAAATSRASLDAKFRGVSYGGNAAVWVQLHTAVPGAAGTTAIATNSTRHQVTFAAAASSGTTATIANSVAITWSTSEVTASEDYSHFSLWTASTAGTFLGAGLMTANAASAGNTFTVAIGALVVSENISS